MDYYTSMAFGIYVHIPYCLQKCHYCDFVTVPTTHAITPEVYTQLLIQEIRSRGKHVGRRKLTSLYFGGGTPSLLSADSLSAIISALQLEDFSFDPEIEITVEINPGTVDSSRLNQYLSLGINRFSVGVQSFDDIQLSRCGREHNSQATVETLGLLSGKDVNFSADLIFGLPQQDINALESDVNRLITFRPKHISLYNLTIPQKHFLNRGRASDGEQAEMFNFLTNRLGECGYRRYEISNFSTPGFESQHNHIYWSDQPYWGIGVGAHSYLPTHSHWGTRFWNPNSMVTYRQQVEDFDSTRSPFFHSLPSDQIEYLSSQESLTDYCHTHLRRTSGITLKPLKDKYGETLTYEVQSRLMRLANMGTVEKVSEDNFRLSLTGLALANQVFLELTFI